MRKKMSQNNLFSLDNPAVQYGIIDCSLHTTDICGDRSSIKMGTAVKTHPTTYKRMMEEVVSWERVETLPDNVYEWYEVEIRIMHDLCLIHLIQGRSILETHHGYVKILEIDEIDA